MNEMTLSSLIQPALLSSIAILRANRKKITPEFLYYTLKTPAIKKDVRDNYGSGSAIPRVVLKDFKRMPFSYPDIDEQRKITAGFNSLFRKLFRTATDIKTASPHI